MTFSPFNRSITEHGWWDFTDDIFRLIFVPSNCLLWFYWTLLLRVLLTIHKLWVTSHFLLSPQYWSIINTFHGVCIFTHSSCTSKKWTIILLELSLILVRKKWNMPRVLYDEVVSDFETLGYQQAIHIRLFCSAWMYGIHEITVHIIPPLVDCTLSLYVTSNNVGSPFWGLIQ